MQNRKSLTINIIKYKFAFSVGVISTDPAIIGTYIYWKIARKISAENKLRD